MSGFSKLSVRASWIFAILVLALVIAIATHFTEHRQLLETVKNTDPQWLLLAFLVQLPTYPAQGLIWTAVLRQKKTPLPLAVLTRVGVGQLFMNQAVPTASVSGTLFVVKALDRHRVPKPIIAKAFVTDLIGAYGAYGISLITIYFTILRTATHHQLAASAAIWPVVAFFATICFIGARFLRGGKIAWDFWGRIPLIKKVIELFRDSDTEPLPWWVIGTSMGLKGLILFIDAVTLCFCLQAVGASADLPVVFCAYILSCMARFFGFLPSGIGTFEAVSVSTLAMFEVPVAAGLAATLLFRGLTFWMPMLPGLWVVRDEMKKPV